MNCRTAYVSGLLTTLLTAGSAHAYEFGSSPWSQPPGIVLGDAATAPPPGIYMFNQVSTAPSSKIVGPGAPNVGGVPTKVRVDNATTGLLFVPGWSFLGGTYDAVVVQPFTSVAVTAPNNISTVGAVNSSVIQELSWKLGDSGFFVKAGLGITAPDGTITGPAGLSSVGAPWWTFQPEFAISYLREGWNFTANIFEGINTTNSITGYTSGDVLHAEFTATKSIGQWTVGPVGYYIGQITDDKASSTFYSGAINTNRYDIWAAGGLVAYDFGPATLKVWAVDQVYANASGGTAGPPGVDTASITKGWSAFASLSYRLWAPDAPQSSKPGMLTLK
jgi:hypothetical protein